jgi:hypothetical protein
MSGGVAGNNMNMWHDRKCKYFWFSSGFEPSVFEVTGDVAVYS